jgi:hypothetical protein
VAIILAGVAMLAMLLTLAIGAWGQPERNYTARAGLRFAGRHLGGRELDHRTHQAPDMSPGGQANF